MSIADTNRRLDRIEAELNRLRSQTLVRVGFPQKIPLPIIIIGGQSLGTFGGIETFGIMKYTAGTLTGIANGTYSPGTVDEATGEETAAPTPGISSWPTGLGYGTSWNGLIYERVIVCNDTRGTATTALIGGSDDDTTYAPSWRQETILAQRTVQVVKLDTSAISAWSPDLA